MENELKRLIYRSKNPGNKEMDFVLGYFAHEGINSLNNSELKLYSNLLEESDNDLWDWITGRMEAPQEYSGLIKKINARRI